MIKTIKLVIFDLDDTLVSSNINYSQIRRSVADCFPQPLLEDTIEKTPILQLLEKLKQEYPEKYPEGYRIVDEAEKAASLNARIIEGAEKIPAILKKYAIQSVIFTNNSKDTVASYLSKPKFNFLKTFKIFTREDFSHPKPNPEGFISIIEEFKDKQITKGDTLYIGDSYIDAIAADRADIRFVWFNSRNIDQSLFPSPPFATLTDWSDFESILEG
ncbi:MAG: HAD hydrolase-like protein [Candidatus Heimdallarchaeota archaeon]|nr:MAG: HAD hydrolase-like protein [Candidatus Heimdallarchaeota archaeon]